MLHHIHINGFRCLRAVDAELKPLTVLVGLNDTGKSTFIDAIETLGASRGVGAADGWHHKGQPLIVGELANDRTILRREGMVAGTIDLLKIHLPAGGPEMRALGTSGDVPTLGGNGAGTATFVDWLLRKDRSRFDRFTRTVAEQVPGVVDIGVETPTADTREIFLHLDDGLWLPADEASAGVRVLLFFVALVHHPVPPSILLVEEPENGLHPHRLSYVMKILRGLTEGAFGAKPVQVILSTHSPHLLDHVDPAKDQVLVFKRLPDGSRTAEPADAARLATFLDEFKLGEVWFNQREEGLVARPSGA